MSVVVRIRLWPRDAATGAVIPVFLAGGNNGAPFHDGDHHYRAGILSDPRFSAATPFTDQEWGGRAVPQASAIGWMPSDPAQLDELATLYWRDAAIEVDRVSALGVQRRLTGTVAEASVGEGRMVITCADLSKDLDKPVTASAFAGTGGIEGGDYAAGRAKRRSFGLVWDIEGRLLDKANNIYEFGDPAYPLLGCSALRDKGRAGPLGIVAWQGSIDATLNALRASAPQNGGGVFAPSIACAKWYTKPVGPLCADLRGEAAGYSENAAGIVAQLLARAGGPAIGDAGPPRPAPMGIHIGDNSETTAEALNRLLQKVGMGWRPTLAGTVDIWEYGFTPVETLQAAFISRESTLQPVKSFQVGYRKNERIHGDGEISAALLASDVIYDDGTTAEYWKPAEPGADVTGDHTAKDVRELAGRLVADVLSQIDIDTQGLIQQGLRQDDAQQVLDARTLVDGQPVGGQFKQFRSEVITDIGALESFFTLLGAKSEDGTSWILDGGTVQAYPGKALGSYITEVGGKLDGLDASAALLLNVILGPDGNESRAVLRTDVNGNLAAVVLSSGEEYSRIGLIAGSTIIAKPDGTQLAAFGVEGDLVYISNLLVDRLRAGSVTIEEMALGFSNVISFTGGDSVINNQEATIIETPSFWLGDGQDGNGLATINYVHDSEQVIDTVWMIRTYVDYGDGFGVPIRSTPEGVRTSNGNTKYTLPVTYVLPLSSATPIRIKITAQSISYGGAGAINGAYARNPRIDILKLGR